MLEAKDQEHKRNCSKKKKVFKKFFQTISKKSSKIFQGFFSKKRFLKFFFQAIYKILTIQKNAVFEPRTGQFLRPRGQGQEFDL